MHGQPVKHMASSGGIDCLASARELGSMQEKCDPVEWAGHFMPFGAAFG